MSPPPRLLFAGARQQARAGQARVGGCAKAHVTPISLPSSLAPSSAATAADAASLVSNSTKPYPCVVEVSRCGAGRRRLLARSARAVEGRAEWRFAPGSLQLARAARPAQSPPWPHSRRAIHRAHLGEPSLAVEADGHAQHLAVLPEQVDQVVVRSLLVDPRHKHHPPFHRLAGNHRRAVGHGAGAGLSSCGTGACVHASFFAGCQTYPTARAHQRETLSAQRHGVRPTGPPRAPGMVRRRRFKQSRRQRSAKPRFLGFATGRPRPTVRWATTDVPADHPRKKGATTALRLCLALCARRKVSRPARAPRALSAVQDQPHPLPRRAGRIAALRGRRGVVLCAVAAHRPGSGLGRQAGARAGDRCAASPHAPAVASWLPLIAPRPVSAPTMMRRRPFARQARAPHRQDCRR